MPRESHPFRTMREMITGLDRARLPGRFLTTNEAFSLIDSRDLLPHVNEKAIAVALEQERRKFARQSQTIARCRQKLKANRARLYAMKVKNERLMALRHALQKRRWVETESAIRQHESRPCISHNPGETRIRNFREVKVRKGL